ncbi:uncharacterized protein LOC122059403 isoform X2 [Macadamia integrifolia]|uniref:uncharacterized protein LOC122059403 isoform X2 n=1 Tax=Macadamia integrifolia TaxID=60698 RepID=UPI001C52A93A|nr:uncharacterized protein LOC122059403 isoform X2 [Macadamia integrifolia]
MVGLKDLKMRTIFVLLMIYMVLCKSVAEGDRSLSKKDDNLDLGLQLKLLNKPAVKSLYTKYGDIYDCVDIKKQPAFDHPLLKNHTIQMKPSSFPTGLIDEELLESIPSKTEIKSIRCPPQTVLIRRTQKEDIVRAKSQVRRYPRNAHRLKAKPGYHYATFQVEISDLKYYGAKVSLSLDQPKVSSTNQFSEAVLWVENGPIDQINSIQVGWTADGFHKTGCFNLLCPGFVQVSRVKTIGMAYELVSVYGGPKYEDHFYVFKDPKSGNWWYTGYKNGRNEPVGYWPSSLFTSLRDFANTISSGGEVYNPTNEHSFQMGNGHFPMGNTLLASSARRLQYVDQKSILGDVHTSLLRFKVSSPKCYKAEFVKPNRVYWINSILFGGPGGAC